MYLVDPTLEKEFCFYQPAGEKYRGGLIMGQGCAVGLRVALGTSVLVFTKILSLIFHRF